MRSRISIEAWLAFVAGLYVFHGAFLIAFWLPALTAVVFPKDYPASAREILDAGEALLLATGSFFIGVRLLLVGRRYIAVAIWYMAICIVLTLIHNGVFAGRVSLNDYAALSLAMGLASQLVPLILLIYVRARAAREA